MFQMANMKVTHLKEWHYLQKKSLALHFYRTTFVWIAYHSPSGCQLALVLGRTDDTGPSRTHVPTNSGELCGARETTLQRVLVGGSFWVWAVTAEGWRDMIQIQSMEISWLTSKAWPSTSDSSKVFSGLFLFLFLMFQISYLKNPSGLNNSFICLD